MATRCPALHVVCVPRNLRYGVAQDVSIDSPTGTASLLRVDIVFDGPRLPKKLEASAMEEVTKIWASFLRVDVLLFQSERRPTGRASCAP